jgi:amino acid adenylation domain-containing protein
MAFLLHQLLSESAAKYPGREAIIFGGQTITYAELERESNKLANKLVAIGIEKEIPVGIHMNRGIKSIIAAFGILKAGGTYVPIDPMSPPRRLEYIIGKCGIKSLITIQGKLKNINEVFSGDSPLDNLLVMDGLPKTSGSAGTTRLIDCQNLSDELGEKTPDVAVIDSDPAYILFTSGSTGDPKGVMISHLNSLTFINSVHDFLGITKEDRFSNICPLHFDMSVFDIFVAVKTGASVVIIPEMTATFPIKLAELIAGSKISVWNSVPSALSLLASLSNLDNFDFSSMRLVLFAGEVFPIKYLRLLQGYMPEAKFCNMYGQTEANTSTYYWVGDLPPDAAAALPIGRPLPNFEVFALDEGGDRVSRPGQEGELYVRSSSVALGYYGDAERTGKSFVKNPLKHDFEEIVYRTGDLVSVDSEGNYVFLGRKDHMIKSRGYRIEIGEIETALSSHPEIKNAAVVPIPDELIGNRIIAFVVLVTPGKIGKEEILKYCSKRLPKYMIPENIEFRNSLPTTSSGKIDRKALA